MMHPFQWCNGESPGREGERTLGWPQTRWGARLEIRGLALFLLS